MGSQPATAQPRAPQRSQVGAGGGASGGGGAGGSLCVTSPPPYHFHVLGCWGGVLGGPCVSPPPPHHFHVLGGGGVLGGPYVSPPPIISTSFPLGDRVQPPPRTELGLRRPRHPGVTPEGGADKRSPRGPGKVTKSASATALSVIIPSGEWDPPPPSTPLGVTKGGKVSRVGVLQGCGEWVMVPQGSPGVIWSLRTPQPAGLSGVTGSQWSPMWGSSRDVGSG